MPELEKTEDAKNKLSDGTPGLNLLELYERHAATGKQQTLVPQQFSLPRLELHEERRPSQVGTQQSSMFSNGLKLSTSDSLLSSNKNASAVIMPLNDYLSFRDTEDKQQSYYRTATTYLSRLTRHALGAEDASAEFDHALRAGDAQGMMRWQDADRKQRALEQNIGFYSAAVLKTALLFCGPKTAYVGLMGISAADQASPSDSLGKQAVDALLGSAKGAASRFMFDKINATSLNPVTKGWLYGVSDRFIDVGLTSNNYLTKAGELTPDSLKAGLWKTGESVFGPDALKADAGTLLVSHAVMLPIGYARGGAFFSNPLYAKATFAGVSGLSNGALVELNRQQDLGRDLPIDWWEVSKRGLEKAAINTVSSLPPSKVIQVLEQKK